MSRPRKPDFTQADLFSSSTPLRSQVITRRRDFDELFDGFSRMRAISYVMSVELLLDFYDKRGYTDVEVLVGDNLSESYKQELEQRNIEVVERLAGLVEKGSLRVFVPTHTVHTKLYILERNDLTRVIQTSANLTATAQEARRQTNYAWYLDLPAGHPLLTQFAKDYESHLHGCSLFMGDLKELLEKNEDRDRKQLIEAWLRGAVTADEQDVEIRGIFHELTASLLEPGANTEEKVTVLHLPESEPARKRVERQLVPLKPISVGQNQLQVNRSSFIRYVYEAHRVPLLLVAREKEELLLGVGASLAPLSEALPDPGTVNQGLELIESYVNTVDLAESANPLSAKTSMFEALLYLFFSPFANEYMKAKRARFGLIDTRGPRFLFIYGPSHNGKTTFLKFALKLITGQMMEALSRQDFTKTRITNATLTETAFPLIFDDVDPSATRGIEDVFKSYWERWWRGEYVSPQLIITSNTPRLKEWAKSRVKRIDFDVHFISTEASRERLNRLFDQDNRVFKWYSHLYLEALNAGEPASDDELLLSRKVMRQLYLHAARPVPVFFPDEPIEKTYDPGRKDWQDLLYGIRKATAENDGKRKLVTFAKDMQHWEINDYQSYLPQTIKHQRRGNTIIIENPHEFDKWLGLPPTSRGLLSRIFRRGGRVS
ncbi:MAG: hypothetical protein HYX90_02200 [Chloroflexi bacterium]|nr:hypothetical protein [Chloroflexota bacterium]